LSRRTRAWQSSQPIICRRSYTRSVIDTEFGRLSIRLRNRKTVALKDLTMQVEPGEIFGLLGPNGAGKTTTIKILMGIHYPPRARPACWANAG
jgi:ABC-type uncharacterized transport system ATPase subunit